MLSRRPFGRVALTVGVALVSSTCDATTALAPPRVEPVVLSFVGDTVLRLGRAAVPQVRAELRGEPLASSRFRFSSADTAIISITAGGDSLDAQRRGCTSVTMRLESSMFGDNAPSLRQAMCVVVGAIAIDRTNPVLESLGDTLTLGIVAADGQGRPLTGLPVNWVSTDSTVVEIASTGRLTAKGVGSVQVRASIDSSEASTTVTVTQRLASFTFAPAAIVLDALGVDTTTQATARDANGSAMDVTVAVWQSRDTTVAAVSPSGVISARDNGVTHVLASRGVVVDSLRVEVRQRATRVVITAMHGLRIDALGDELVLSGRGYDRSDYTILDLNPGWRSLAPTVAEVPPGTGRVTGLATGTAAIVATLHNREDTVVVTVDNVPVGLDVIPGDVTLTSIGDDVLLRAFAVNRRGASIPDQIVSWHTNDAQVIALGSDGRVTALTEGVASVIATARDVADTARVEVVNRPASIAIVPDSHTFAFPLDTLTPDVDIRNARGAPLARTSVSWSSEDAAVATVTASSGVITARGVGRTVVRASSGAIVDSLIVVVRNDPVSLTLDGSLDTLTALGQQIPYVATVRNARGDILTHVTPSWHSTSASVVSVSAGGTASATGFGTARVIADADGARDSVTIVVHNPTLLYVDNGVVASPRVGTLARPYLSIQDAVNAADAFDTVLVRPGATPYSETVSLARRITLLGDSTAYLANGRNPLRLPIIAHDTGSAGIVAHTRAPVTIRYLAILHSVDGAAIDVLESDVSIERVYVNPDPTGLRIGRGILLRDVTAAALISNTTIRGVRGYGVLLQNVPNGRLTAVRVTDVGLLSGQSGAGIEVAGGTDAIVEQSRIRGTAGPQILVSSSPRARITGNDLAGRHQLIRIAGSSSGVEVSTNTFELTQQPEDPGSGGSETDGRSGLEVRDVPGATILGNVFTETGSGVMDAIRLIDVRPAGAGGTGAQLLDNRFRRGRHAVRSERSTWEMMRSRADSAVLPILAAGADTILLADDTLSVAMGSGCIAATGANVRLTVQGSSLSGCSASATVGQPAITVQGTNAVLSVLSSAITGANQTAIRFTGRRLLVRATGAVRTDGTTVGSFAAAGAIEAVADTIRITGSVIRRHSALAALWLSGGVVEVDSNHITRNGTGIRLGSFTELRLADNDVFDHETAGVANAAGGAGVVADNWWGDGRGPRGASPGTVGDTLVGALDPTPYRLTPLGPGSIATDIRKLRGDGQVMPRRSILNPFVVRIVDASGRAVPGVAVTFTIVSGGGMFVPSNTSSVIVTTNASGLAEATLELGPAPGTTTVRVSVPGLTPVTFTAQGT